MPHQWGENLPFFIHLLLGSWSLTLTLNDLLGQLSMVVPDLTHQPNFNSIQNTRFGLTLFTIKLGSNLYTWPY